MYKVHYSQHPKHGYVVMIEPVEDGQIETPFFAWQRALTLRRQYKEGGGGKCKFVVVDQLMTAKQLEFWQHEEYLHLPKCTECGHILPSEVYKNATSGQALFCSPRCAEKNALVEVEDECCDD